MPKNKGVFPKLGGRGVDARECRMLVLAFQCGACIAGSSLENAHGQQRVGRRRTWPGWQKSLIAAVTSCFSVLWRLVLFQIF